MIHHSVEDCNEIRKSINSKSEPRGEQIAKSIVPDRDAPQTRVGLSVIAVCLRSPIMDYTPRHNQPFTLEQAVHLDVAIITEGLWEYDVAWSQC